jgi:hypothetical protein
MKSSGTRIITRVLRNNLNKQNRYVLQEIINYKKQF